MRPYRRSDCESSPPTVGVSVLVFLLRVMFAQNPARVDTSGGAPHINAAPVSHLGLGQTLTVARGYRIPWRTVCLAGCYANERMHAVYACVGLSSAARGTIAGVTKGPELFFFYVKCHGN